MPYYHNMDLGLTDQYAVRRAEWLVAVVAISQTVHTRALTKAGLVHAVAVCHLRGLFGVLAPGRQSCQSTSCLDASGAQVIDPVAISVLALA